jgi:hypothetical protein
LGKTLSFYHVAGQNWHCSQMPNHVGQSERGRGSVNVPYKDIKAMVPAAQKKESLVGNNYLCVIDRRYCNAGQQRKIIFLIAKVQRRMGKWQIGSYIHPRMRALFRGET